MTVFETLSILVALIAVVISCVSLIRTSKVQREQARLDQITGELMERQIEALDHESRSSQLARVTAALEGASPEWAFYLANEGSVPAKNVHFELLGLGPGESPLLSGDYDRKIPAPILQPGSTIKLFASITMGSPTTFNARVSWENPDGTTQEDDYFLSL